MNIKLIFLISLVFISYIYLDGFRLLNSGFPLDDAYIHLQYAKNFAQYQQFYYNMGEIETGATSPLWAIILSIAFFLKFHPIIWSKFLGVFFHYLNSVLLFEIGKKYIKNEKINLLISILYLLSPTLLYYSFSGMEVNLFIFLALLSFVINGPEIGIILGLICLSRPEGLIFSGVMLINKLIKKEKILIPLTFILLIILPWIIYCQINSGRPLPSTFYAKTRGIHIPEFGSIIGFFLWPLHEVYFSIGFLLLLFYSGKNLLEKEQLPLTFYPLMMGIFLVSYFIVALFYPYGSRYFAITIPFGALLLGIGLDKIDMNKFLSKVIFVLGIFSIIMTILISTEFPQRYINDVQSIDNLQVHIAKDIIAKLPNNSIIAVSDAGAIAYYGNPTHRFVDVLGLNSYKKIGKTLKEFINEEKPSYAIVIDEMVDGIENIDKEKIQEITYENYTVTSSNKFTLYKLNH